MPRARWTVSMAVIFMVAHYYDTSYSRKYGRRAAERPDLLDADDPSRIRPRLGGNQARRRHAHAGRPGDAESSGARGLAGDRVAAADHIAIRSRVYRL